MIRRISAIWLSKLVFFITRTLKIGGGSAAPGYYALKIYPNLVADLASQIPQNVIITGTNGKTTTARLLNHFAKTQKIKVARNSTGSNLERGIASALIEAADFWGRVKGIDLGIWEVDEAVFNSLVFKIKPNLIVFLNVFRDQLDRYGEVDTVVSKWHRSLEKIDWNPAILINSGNTHTLSLTIHEKKQIFGFSVKNHFVMDEKGIYVGVLPSKNFPDHFSAKIIKNLGLSGTQLELSFPSGKLQVKFQIPGIYHVYDLLAAFGAYFLLNLPVTDIKDSLKDFEPAFGRVENFKLGEKDAFIFLIKNPAGVNSVFETIEPELRAGDKLLIALNDNFADGTDVSWIWDADFEKLQETRDKIQTICSGTRSYDLALRLKYAGFDQEGLEVVNNLDEAFAKVQSELKGRLFILPTYTALLEFQKILVKEKIKIAYWEEKN